jgi:hypothetical protein
MRPAEGIVTSSARTIVLVTLAALAVAAACYLAAPDVVTGAITATRFSARFSALVFAAAVVARAGRPQFLATRWQSWTFAFVAAHLVHYGTVAARGFLEPGNPLRHPTLQAFAIVGGGVSLLIAIAVTRGRFQSAVFYLAGTLLTLALSSRAIHPAQHPTSTIVLAVLLAALAWRVVCQTSPVRS